MGLDDLAARLEVKRKDVEYHESEAGIARREMEELAMELDTEYEKVRPRGTPYRPGSVADLYPRQPDIQPDIQPAIGDATRPLLPPELQDNHPRPTFSIPSAFPEHAGRGRPLQDDHVDREPALATMHVKRGSSGQVLIG